MKSAASRLLNLTAAALLAVSILAISAHGAGPLPALGSALNPGTGVWTDVSQAARPGNETLHVSGLQTPVTVTFEGNGIAHIHAATEKDLFMAMGYVHATYRLFEMDLARRKAEGFLSEIMGAKYLDDDEFELKLGLTRTAIATWISLEKYPEARRILEAYAHGVNARIEEETSSHTLPAMFKLLGYSPRPWNPIDTLAVQGYEAQDLSLKDHALNNAVLLKAIGYKHLLQWFPVIPSNEQRPYDPGPYSVHGLTPLPSQLHPTQSQTEAVAAVAGSIPIVPEGIVKDVYNSNDWAIDGTKTASGKPLMANDIHIGEVLPSIWYELELDGPNEHVAGVSIPGTPLIVSGHNGHISWGETNGENQATLYYVEKTSPSHPDQYFWKGAWRKMSHVSYEIPVKGGSHVHLDVRLTVHGPIIGDKRTPHQTVSVQWLGSIPSPSVEALLLISRASSFSQFREALRLWKSPTQNFVYADDRGHIGLILAGLSPVVASGVPFLPLPGTGESDVVGTIPFEDMPQQYDPPNHVVVSGNQRPVTGAYPYYIGAARYFDNGFRADRIYQVLSRGRNFTSRDMERLQTDVHDYLAQKLVPRLLVALDRSSLTAVESRAANLLRSWDGNMAVGSAAASIWWGFLSNYVRDTFQPWWRYYHVPVKKFTQLKVSPRQTTLVEDLEAWTLNDPTNPAFSLPGGARRTAPTVMRQAFADAIRWYARYLGTNPAAWTWGRLHTRTIESVLKAKALNYGPRPSDGDRWTVSAAMDGFRSTMGPSWRFIMDWGSGRAEGVYPGGQNENPISPWYQNFIPAWWSDRYIALMSGAAARNQPDSITWRLGS
jgi:penicillin amidase